MTALLGGHIDLATNITPEIMSPNKAGKIRPLGVMDKAESPFLPGVKTFEAQGYPVVSASPVGISAPAGTPKEVVAFLAAAMKKAVNTADWKNKMSELGFTTMAPDPGEYSKFWQETETRVRPLMELAKREAEK
jgi:tripartite-type tricarboxylate transporter receptor subunit TctC